MRWSAVIVLSILCTAVSNAATLTVVNGPWQVWRPDGLRVGIELPRTLDLQQLGELHLRRYDAQRGAWQPEPVQVPFQEAMIERPLRRPTRVVYWDLTGEDARPGRLSLHRDYLPGSTGIAERGFAELTVAARPDGRAAARVAVAGVYNYPDQAQVDALEEALGGTLDAVLLLGDDVGLRVGTGGWEHRLPLIWFPERQPEGDASVLLGPGRAWPMGLRLGPLGLLTAAEDRLASAVIGRDLSPWQVWCDPRGAWDLGLVDSRDRRSVSGLRLLLAAIMRRQVPLMLAAGHSTAFISEPLSVSIDFDQRFGQLALASGHVTTADLRLAQREMRETGLSMKQVLVDQQSLERELANRLETDLRGILAEETAAGEEAGIVVRPGGSRYVCVSAAGGAFAALDESVAWPIHERGCFALAADDQGLDLVFTPAADGSPRRLHFDPLSQGHHGTGWGRLQEAFLAWYEGEELPDGRAASDLSWAPATSYAQAADTPAKVIRLLERAAQGDAPPHLLRRLMTLDPQVCGEWLLAREQPPELPSRDWFLRLLDQPERYGDREVALYLQDCSDEASLRSLLHRIDSGEEEHRQLLLELLLLRFRRQCAGELPPDADPVIQHAVFSHVFCSPRLSADAAADCFVPAVEQATALARQVLLRYLAERARATQVLTLIETSVDPTVLRLVLAVPDAYPRSPRAGVVRDGARRRLRRQLAGEAAWLPPPAQRGLVRLVLADRRLDQEVRQAVIQRLRQRPELSEVLPPAEQDDR